MPAAYLSLLISTGVLCVLMTFFNIEAHRGRRFFARLRGWLDAGADWLAAAAVRAGSFISRDVLQQSAHFFFHQILRVGLRGIRIIEQGLDWLLRRNKALAKRTSRARTTDSGLGEIAEHKEAVALSETEKRAHKERAVGTKL